MARKTRKPRMRLESDSARTRGAREKAMEAQERQRVWESIKAPANPWDARRPVR